MNTIFVHRNGQTEQATSIDRAWLSPGSGAVVWVDLAIALDKTEEEENA